MTLEKNCETMAALENEIVELAACKGQLFYENDQLKSELSAKEMTITKFDDVNKNLRAEKDALKVSVENLEDGDLMKDQKLLAQEIMLQNLDLVKEENFN
jgi:cell division protein FtsB